VAQAAQDRSPVAAAVVVAPGQRQAVQAVPVARARSLSLHVDQSKRIPWWTAQLMRRIGCNGLSGA